MVYRTNNGIQNEYDFVELFNGKYLHELDNNSQKFLKELFGENIDNEERIVCFKNKLMQKSDIHVKYRNMVRGISLKCGNSNSMHHESIESFKQYLEKLGIAYKVIDYYVSYHFGYMRDANNRIDFSKSLSSEEYKKIYQNEIDIFNREINKTRIIIDMVDRFIVRGRNSEYDVDALICGTTNDYIWIMKYELYDMILSRRCIEFTSPHIACMTIGPKKRNLDGMSRNAGERYVVCIRWNFIRETIESFKKLAG